VAGAYDKYNDFTRPGRNQHFNIDAASETTPITADAAINQLTPVLAANRRLADGLSTDVLKITATARLLRLKPPARTMFLSSFRIRRDADREMGGRL
jgi:hypothetical protein